jgi:hypothetical protein
MKKLPEETDDIVMEEIEVFSSEDETTPLSRVYNKLKSIDPNLEFMHNLYVGDKGEK